MDQQIIGRHLAEKRKEKQLTQAQLAELLGVSDRSVSRWENGVTMPEVSPAHKKERRLQRNVIKLSC